MNDNLFPSDYWQSEWLDDFGDLDESVTEEQLLFEFEKQLKEKNKKLPPIPKIDPRKCAHVWEIVGRSPVLNTVWYNCKYCAIKKEDHENPK